MNQQQYRKILSTTMLDYARALVNAKMTQSILQKLKNYNITI